MPIDVPLVMLIMMRPFIIEWLALMEMVRFVVIQLANGYK